MPITFTNTSISPLLPPPQLIHLRLACAYHRQQFLIENLSDLANDGSLSDGIEQGDCTDEDDHEDVHDGVLFIAEPDVVVDEEGDDRDKIEWNLLAVCLVTLPHHSCILVGCFALEVLLDGEDPIGLEEGLGSLVVFEGVDDHGGAAFRF